MDNVIGFIERCETGSSARFAVSRSKTHLVLPDHSHATAAAAIGRLEDDGEAVGLGKHLRLLQAGDGGICSGDHGNP